MPTGYTMDVQDGKITAFSDFAMRCARAFGALVEMRDDSMDAPIPDKFEVSDYHVKAKANAEARLVQLVAMTEDECRDAALVEFQEAEAGLVDYKEKALLHKGRYLKMLAEARRWTPPTPDHEGLRKFMIEQLQQSIDHDCNTSFYPVPVLKPGREWHVDAVAKAQKDIKYHTEQMIEDEKRSRTRTEWVKSLRASLNPVTAS
jgi:hypothetical protein